MVNQLFAPKLESGTVLSLIQELPLSCQGTLGILTFLIKFIDLAIWAIQGYPRDLSHVEAFRVFSEFLSDFRLIPASASL